MAFGPERLTQIDWEAGMSRAKDLAKRFLNERLLGPLECLVAPPPGRPLADPPVFLVGPPRSGSTLMMQVITDAFDVGYLSNAHCRFYGAPALVERLAKPAEGRPPSNYESELGRTAGAHAPAECGDWWYRFFPREPAYIQAGDADPGRMRCFRRSLLALTEAFGTSVVFKNLYATLRLGPIHRHVPSALFIVVRRDLVDTARSIAESRMKYHGDYDVWFSVPPPGRSSLVRLSVPKQVVGQVWLIRDLIEEAMGTIGRDRFLILEYESFCEDVAAALERVEQFFSDHGLTVGRSRAVPSSFRPRTEVNLPDSMYRRIEHCARDRSWLQHLTDNGPAEGATATRAE